MGAAQMVEGRDAHHRRDARRVDALDAVDRRVDYLITHAPPGRVRGLLKTEDDSMMNALAVYFEELSGAVSL